MTRTGLLRLASRFVGAPALAASLAGLACGAPLPAESAGLTWWTTHALDKVRPDGPPGAGRGVELSAARNEFEPFQLVLRAEGRSLRTVDAELTDLAAEEGGGAIASRHATLYLQRYLHLDTPSSVQGETGPWPDPLVPRVDPYAGERRNAFPFDLEPGRNQPLWIDLYVPPGTPPGRYRGEVRVSAAGEHRVAVPVSLRVWPFVLPSTSSLATSYGYSGPPAVTIHRGSYTSDDHLLELAHAYREAALRHRVSLHGGSMLPPPTTFGEGRARVDWSGYDLEVGPFLDGTVFGADDALPGARATSIDLTTPPVLTDEERVLYWRAWAEHFREKGWLERLFLYLPDEPQGPGDYPEVLRLARLAKEADPELTTLVTEQYVPGLAEAIDVWVPLIQCIEERPGVGTYCEETVPRRAYARAEEGGARVWWYQSCVSHGCNVVGGRELAGWPSYVIDAPPVAHRIMPWLAFHMGIDGELYYNTVEAYARGLDPWDRVHTHGGNGDGILFYPGTPRRIGGATHVPVPSLRLKLIREALEDYEYLALLAEHGRGEAARARAKELAPATFRWEPDPEALYSARETLARELSKTPAADRRWEEWGTP